MSDYIHTRLKVSKTHGVKLCLFCEKGVELYDKHIWTVDKNGNTFYLHRINREKQKIKFHRELLSLKDGEIYDHINRNGLDNRICNLRPSTQQQNKCNQGIQKNNTSGIKGVHWCKEKNKWVARVRYDNGRCFVGHFDDIKEAERVVLTKREELHGSFANHG